MESASLKLADACACAQNVERALKRAAGVDGASVNFADESATITFDPSATSVEDLIQVVRDAGYEAQEEAAVAEDAEDLERSRAIALQGRLFGAGAVVSAVIMALSMGGAFAGRDAILLLLATAVQAGLGWQFYRNSAAARSDSGYMDVLIALGSSTAYVYSVARPERAHGHLYFDAAMILTLRPGALPGDESTGQLGGAAGPAGPGTTGPRCARWAAGADTVSELRKVTIHRPSRQQVATMVRWWPHFGGGRAMISGESIGGKASGRRGGGRVGEQEAC